MPASLTDRFDPRVAHERQMLVEALSTGLSGRSEMVQRYECGLKVGFEAQHAIAVSSGFGALVVALSALGLKPGDHVMLTPTCPLCTVYALTFMQLEPVFCDIQPDNFSVDIGHAERRFDVQIKAIIDIPMWGYPVPAEHLAHYARCKGVPLVLDVALAHRAKLHDRFLWSYADVATFSTHASKNLVTGEGGAVLTNNAVLAEAALRFSYPDRQAEDVRLNYSLGGLQAALGLARLTRLEEDSRCRRAHIDMITSQLDNPHLEALPVVDGGELAGTKLIIRETSGSNRALLTHQQRAGVPSDIATYDCKPLYQYPVMKAHSTPCPNAEAMLNAITTIPVHPDIDTASVQHIVRMLNDYRP